MSGSIILDHEQPKLNHGFSFCILITICLDLASLNDREENA
jgi:hypothetical protein